MNADFHFESIIHHLKGRKRRLFLYSLVMAIIISLGVYFFKLKVYGAQLRFFITNSEAVDYKSILDKSFIDISVEGRDLLRLQSFGHSNQLLQNVRQDIQKDASRFSPAILESVNAEGGINYLASLYEVSITELGEIEITVMHQESDFAEYLSHQIMDGINDMNNAFLSEFKQEQIIASERQIELLNQEKKEVLSKVNELSEKVKEVDVISSIQQFEKQLSSGRLSYEEVQEFVLQQNNAERLELGLYIQKISSLDENIESFNRTLYNDRWSLEMLKKKKPFVTQDKPPKQQFTRYGLFMVFVASFLLSFFFFILITALRFRYAHIIRLLFS